MNWMTRGDFAADRMTLKNDRNDLLVRRWRMFKIYMVKTMLYSKSGGAVLV